MNKKALQDSERNYSSSHSSDVEQLKSQQVVDFTQLAEDLLCMRKNTIIKQQSKLVEDFKKHTHLQSTMYDKYSRQKTQPEHMSELQKSQLGLPLPTTEEKPILTYFNVFDSVSQQQREKIKSFNLRKKQKPTSFDLKFKDMQ